MNQNSPWHCLSAEKAAQSLETDLTGGVTADNAAERLKIHGPNRIQRGAKRTPLYIFAAQFADFMILVLVVAAIVSGVVGELRDSIAIVVIVILNAIIGTVQEYRAQRAIAALQKMAAPEATVIRGGKTETISADRLVPGDLVLLEAGNVVPADLRLSDASQLQVDESALTGESHAVSKQPDVLEEPDLTLGDRWNMAFNGTMVTRGHGKGIVVATGMDSEMGHIAAMLKKEESARTPLQIRLARFGRHLAVAILIVCIFIFAAGLLQDQPVLLMFLTAVSLAVAAIPEALPAVVTISLALGARKLSRRNALVRRLPAVETLGSVTYICSDKTGTLTQNRMRVEALFADDRRVEKLPDANDGSRLWQRLGQTLALNNTVTGDPENTGESGEASVTGDPTEVALYQAAQQAGFDKAALLKQLPQVAELAFDEDRKCMTTLHQSDAGIVAFTKGAPEAVLDMCSDVLGGAGNRDLDQNRVQEQAEALAAEGFRVLAVACREFSELPEDRSPDTIETGLTFLGLVAMMDPPREEAAQAVADCLAAGIVPVMITGDHPATARSIARRLGIADEHDRVMTGRELKKLSDEEFDEQARDLRIYARVNPKQKIRIVKALQEQGEFVAMTGDGVNDAPALKRAGIGVAMGKKGTDVAREAADMVLLDDNFATIVSAIREGRRIFDDIRKFIKYTMTSNSGEIWTLVLAMLLGLPLPLLPIHILWINLVTDGLPGLALASEPAERKVMQRDPRSPQENIFAHGMWQHIVFIGILIGVLSIGAQIWAIDRQIEHWQTIVFTTLTFAQLFHVMAIRSERDSLFSIGLFSNPQLIGAVVLTVVLQLAVIYTPFLNDIFKTAPLPLDDLMLCVLLASVVFAVVEIEKWMVRGGWLYDNRV
ncbi:calcium-translocating P-type ATPase, PMCA-type [Nitrosomonas marina]|uniref:P-type Ca(2+) transporter n=1 Tax=Nitrosomonas marina TaxID=917 RepID=A0A1H8AP39_9PROT|nr:calcium-translocating P-type ATPase, PMCA-type [Nitrosomonas marina]SEM71287.1 Ca2+-transporting ATPase [Nitrosomonas marina]